MNGWEVLVPLLSAVTGALVGGYVVHRLTIRREELSARRAKRIESLIASWRAILAMANRTEGTPSTITQREAYEDALTDIMLLGERPEIEATAAFIKAVGAGEQTNLDAVIEALRESLRNELQLPEVPLPQDRILRIDWNDVDRR